MPPAFRVSPTGRRGYAELPHVSTGYPPPQGRLPTCSSPVRHVSRRSDPVRLACIRHAASVYPEPGSNSPSGGVRSGPRRPQREHPHALSPARQDVPPRGTAPTRCRATVPCPRPLAPSSARRSAVGPTPTHAPAASTVRRVRARSRPGCANLSTSRPPRHELPARFRLDHFAASPQLDESRGSGHPCQAPCRRVDRIAPARRPVSDGRRVVSTLRPGVPSPVRPPRRVSGLTENSVPPPPCQGSRTVVSAVSSAGNHPVERADRRFLRDSCPRIGRMGAQMVASSGHRSVLPHWTAGRDLGSDMRPARNCWIELVVVDRRWRSRCRVASGCRPMLVLGAGEAPCPTGLAPSARRAFARWLTRVSWTPVR